MGARRAVACFHGHDSSVDGGVLRGIHGAARVDRPTPEGPRTGANIRYVESDAARTFPAGDGRVSLYSANAILFSAAALGVVRVGRKFRSSSVTGMVPSHRKKEGSGSSGSPVCHDHH